MNIQYLVINLAEKKERWHRMLNLAEETGITLTRVEAFSPSTIPVKTAFSEIFNCYLSPQQLGCYFSHRETWKRIAEGPSEFAVVLEDDAVFSTDLVSFVEKLKEKPFDFDIIRLEETYKGDSFTSDATLIKIGNITLGRIYSPSQGAGAIVVSKKGAQKLLNIAQPVLTVDELLFNKYSPIWGKLENYQVKEVLVWQLLSFGLDKVPGFESSLSSKAKKKTKKKKSLKTSIKKLIIKIKYLAKLKSMKTQEVELDNSRKQKLEKHEKDRFSIVS